MTPRLELIDFVNMPIGNTQYTFALHSKGKEYRVSVWRQACPTRGMIQVEEQFFTELVEAQQVLGDKVIEYKAYIMRQQGIEDSTEKELTEHLLPGDVITTGVTRKSVYEYESEGGTIKFQQGDPRNGRNGFTDEELIVMMLDRRRTWQEGELATRDNAISITKLEELLLRMFRRSLDRIKRNVRGTNQK